MQQDVLFEQFILVHKASCPCPCLRHHCVCWWVCVHIHTFIFYSRKSFTMISHILKQHGLNTTNDMCVRACECWDSHGKYGRGSLFLRFSRNVRFEIETMLVLLLCICPIFFRQWLLIVSWFALLLSGRSTLCPLLFLWHTFHSFSFCIQLFFFLSRSISLRWMVFVRTRNINGVIFTLPGISSRHFQVFFTLNRGTPKAKLVFSSPSGKKEDGVNLTPFKCCMCVCAPFLLCTI